MLLVLRSVLVLGFENKERETDPDQNSGQDALKITIQWTGLHPLNDFNELRMQCCLLGRTVN